MGTVHSIGGGGNLLIESATGHLLYAVPPAIADQLRSELKEILDKVDLAHSGAAYLEDRLDIGDEHRLHAISGLTKLCLEKAFDSINSLTDRLPK